MKKASVYSLIKSSIKDENYKGTRVIVFDENHNLILSEEIEKITRQTDAMAEIDKELEKEFCAEIDNIFDSDVSSKAFKYVPPLAMVTDEDGECEMYILLVLKALAIEIQKYGNKMNNATNKYVAKYPKNK